MNCFIVAIDRAGAPYLLVKALDGGVLVCDQWNGKEYATPAEIAFRSVKLNDFHVTHYYGLSEIRYEGFVDLAFNRLSAWPYLKIHFVRLLSRVDQYLFNKKKLMAKARYDLLKVIVSETMEGRRTHHSLDLMTTLYTVKWHLHPGGEAAQRRLEFYLESLVETGELRKRQYEYEVTGIALRAIEDYEEQERKHTESVKMQWRTFWLALAVAILTVVQAGIVKLPVLLDFTSFKPPA